MQTTKHYAELLVVRKPHPNSVNLADKVNAFLSKGGKVQLIPRGVSGYDDRNSLEVYTAARKAYLDGLNKVAP